MWDPGDPHDDISVPDDDHNAQRTYSGLRVVIRAGDALCSGTMMTETLRQTQAVMRGGEEVEYKVVGLASVEDMRWLVRAVNLADEEGEDEEGEDAPADEKAGVDRKKVKDDAPDSAAGVDWKNEPCWEDLPKPLPLQEAPHCILFVGANNSDASELSLKKEAKLMEEKFTSTYGSQAWRTLVVFRHDFFVDMQSLVEALVRHQPVGVHFVCHGHVSALSLYEDHVSVQVLVKTLSTWSSSGSALRLVVANACSSAHLATALSEHVDFVIGHHQPVQDDAAVNFAALLYEYLGSGQSLLDSFRMATSAKGCSKYCLRGRQNAKEFRFPNPSQFRLVPVSPQTASPSGHPGSLGPVHELREVGVRHLEPGQVATRDAHMTRLRDWALLNDAHRIAVVGQGGSGKSTLAQWLLSEVGRGLRPSIRLVFFLQAGDLMRGYRELLAELQRLLGREEKQPDKDEDVRRLVHVLLRDGKVRGTWMGVLDDLPSPANLADHGMGWLLEEDACGFPWGSGKTVVTSRSAEWASDHTL